MVVGAISSRTELAIVGAGPGGYVAALRAADAGIEVTLIERDALGGTCLNVGCVPSKTLIEVANVRSRALQGPTIGLDATVAVRGTDLAAHITKVNTSLRTGVQALLRDAGVTVVSGDASFARYDRLSIASDGQVTHLEFDNAIIATGSRPTPLASLPFGGNVLSSTGALSLDHVPSDMAIVGGGYIGVELGTAWAKLGTRVTIVEAAASLLPGVAETLRTPVQRRLASLGVDVRCATRAVEVVDGGLQLDDGTDIAAEYVVVAIGRTPNSDQASIDSLGLRLSPHGHIMVDHQMRATSGIYAIGDLVPGPALAHKATAEAEVAVDAILGRSPSNDAFIPEVIFSDPEILTVGVGIDDASAAGMAVHRFPHSASARAHTLSSTSGATYLVTDEAGTIVGVSAVGPHVSELAGEATLAVEMAATATDLAFTVHPHPSLSESLAEAAWLATGSPLHVRR